MIAYFLRRLVYMCVLLLAVSLISFAIIELPPGDFLTSYVLSLKSSGLEVSVEHAEALKQQFGLDRPVMARYFMWVGNLLQGDLGFSFQWNKSVGELIGENILLTVIVSIATLIFTWIVAVPIGIYSATHQYSLLDYVLTFVAFIGLAIPGFLLALVLAYTMFKLTGMSAIGLFSPEYEQAPWTLARVLDLIAHMGLPIIIVGTAGTAGLIRVLRGCLLDELSKPYVVTARAKGLNEWRLLLKYPVRIAINPLISTIGWMLPSIVSGSVLVSVVLSLPMTGPLFLRALLSQDMYLAASFVMILSALTIVGTFVSDILLAWSDPRIRFE